MCWMTSCGGCGSYRENWCGCGSRDGNGWNNACGCGCNCGNNCGNRNGFGSCNNSQTNLESSCGCNDDSYETYDHGCCND